MLSHFDFFLNVRGSDIYLFSFFQIFIIISNLRYWIFCLDNLKNETAKYFLKNVFPSYSIGLLLHYK